MSACSIRSPFVTSSFGVENISLDHPHYDQVNKDIVRSLFQIDVIKRLSKRHRLRLRVELARLIHALFSIDAHKLHYVQGFHDVASIVLLVCDPDLDEACEAAAKEDLEKGYSTPDEIEGASSPSESNQPESATSTSASSETATSPETSPEPKLDSGHASDPSAELSTGTSISSASATPDNTAQQQGTTENLFDMSKDDKRDEGRLKILGSHQDALAFGILRKLAHEHLRDTLSPTLERIMKVMELVFPLLNKADAALYEMLQSCHLGSVFTLSWLLTWFSHNISAMSSISRIFDFLLAAHPAMGIYFCVGVIVQLKPYVMQLNAEDPVAVYHFFQKLPSRLDARPIILFSRALWNAYPPSKLFLSCNQIPDPESALHRSHPAELRYGSALDLNKLVSHSPALTTTVATTTSNPHPTDEQQRQPSPPNRWLHQIKNTIMMLRLLRRTSQTNAESEPSTSDSRSGARSPAELWSEIHDTIQLLEREPPKTSTLPTSRFGFSVPVVPTGHAPDDLFIVLREDLEDDDPFPPDDESHGVNVLVKHYPLPITRLSYDHRLAKAVWGPTGRPDISWSTTGNVDWSTLRRQAHSGLVYDPEVDEEAKSSGEEPSTDANSLGGSSDAATGQSQLVSRAAIRNEGTSRRSKSQPNSTNSTDEGQVVPPLWDAGWLALFRASKPTEQPPPPPPPSPRREMYLGVASAAVVLVAAAALAWVLHRRQG